MSIVVRRINRAKWQQVLDENNITDSSADAITNCLKTTKNDLSVWKIDSIDDLNIAILALITGSQQTKLSKIDYVYFEENDLSDRGLSLNETIGDTVIEAYKDKHRDISELTYSKLGVIKDLIIEFLNKNDENFMTRSDLKKLIKSAIDTDIIKIQDLNPELVSNEKLI